jgi:hypothetical protein
LVSDGANGRDRGKWEWDGAEGTGRVNGWNGTGGVRDSGDDRELGRVGWVKSERVRAVRCSMWVLRGTGGCRWGAWGLVKMRPVEVQLVLRCGSMGVVLAREDVFTSEGDSVVYHLVHQRPSRPHVDRWPFVRHLLDLRRVSATQFVSWVTVGVFQHS